MRPLEWFNLAAIHGQWKYLLHDDFYDEQGTALQSEASEHSAVGPPAPSLALAARSLERLVDYCVTRWWVDAEVYEEFAAFASEAILKELERRTEVRNWQVLSTCLGICANALGNHAGEWVRCKFGRATEEGILSAWAKAAASCLPHPEGLHMAMQALGKLNNRDLREQKMALMWFRSPDVLDWIEAHVPSTNISEDWGRLAALSALEWSRAQKWLERGRPLSLVTIDALSEFIPRPGQAPIIGQLAPALQGCDVRSEIGQELRRYMTVDDVPRVTRKCSFIIEQLGQLRLA
ncbi:hypothetical protein [Pelagibius marinus]|uniref:hypothetical protein n=1 Tax=Pelagibius marinus TaxID=2762760 RepID=UPI0018731052|nr:hypothetical protein [Pelagibius marinus]